MFEGCYESLPDIDAYLSRIGLPVRREASLPYLDELIYAHQCSIPFENLDASDVGREIPLDIAALFDKIVMHPRGGYCFELNALFAALLRELGFEVQAGEARVMTMAGSCHPITHRTDLVRLDGSLYVADVGFGGPAPAFALKVEDGYTQTGRGQTFAIGRRDPFWWDLFYDGSQGRINPMRFSAAPSEECDFGALSYFQSTHPDSHFVNTRLVNLRTPEGNRNIRNSVYTENRNGKAESFEITCDAQLDELLTEKFGIAEWR